jgi:hypothetical protein
LVSAQKKAIELGVDKLLFVITPSEYRSKRFNIENSQKIPLVSPIAEIGAMSQITPIDLVGKPLHINDSRYLNSVFWKTFCVIDRVYSSENKLLTIHGWAMDKEGGCIKNISIYCSDQFIGNAKLGLLREDVLRAYPKLRNDKFGFTLTSKLSKTLNSPTEIKLQLMTNEGIIENFSLNYLFVKSIGFIPASNFTDILI